MDVEEILVKRIRFWSFMKWHVYVSLALGFTLGILILVASFYDFGVKAVIGQKQFQGWEAGLIGFVASPILFLLIAAVMAYLLFLPFWMAINITRGLKLKGKFKVPQPVETIAPPEAVETTTPPEAVEKVHQTVPERVSLITIGARNLPVLRSFYQRLGWSESAFSSDTYAVFRTAGVLLSLFPMEELLKDARLNAEDLAIGFKGISFAINVDKPEEVDAAIDAIRKAGGRIIREASDASWGGRIGYFMDPEENAWEVAWNPTAVFDERGAMISF